MTTAELQSLDKQYVWHPFTHMSLWLADDPLVITHGEGVYLIDSDGNRYLDGISSLWCNVHGHRVKAIDDAIRAQLERIAHTTLLGLANDQSAILAKKLIEIAPKGMAKVFYASDGASATEVAFKLAVQYWWNRGQSKKCEFIGLTEAYHGDTTGGMSVGMTSAFHRPYLPLLFKVHYATAPRVSNGECGTSNEVDELEQILRKHHDSIAAICVEPLVMGAAGMIVHPPGYLRAVRELADKYDVLLICDEVATGFGRTGRMFACEHERVTADLMCIGKGLTGGYLPLAATLATQKVFEAFLGAPHEGHTFFHGHTFTGNALACAAAIASIELMEQKDLVARVAHNAIELSKLLTRLADLPRVGEIRQKGYMVGVELVASRDPWRPFDPKQRVGAQICRRLRDRGVLLRPLGDTIVLFPPLVIEVDQLRQIVDAVYQEVAALRDDASVKDRGDETVAGDW
jgi:adenosylmethionine-8-amino-7-oxononanoate aminotransferase